MKVIPGTLLAALASAVLLAPLGLAYGHGYGIDSFPVSLPDGDITVSVELPIEFGQPDRKQLTITATYDETNDAVPNITYMIGMSHAGREIFREHFLAPDGILAIDTIHDTGQIRIDGQQAGPLGAWYGTDSAPLTLAGPVFDSGGLYTFEIQIMTAGTPDAVLPDTGTHYADLTLVDTTEFHRTDALGEPVMFRLKSYFDDISSFEYDYANRELSFEMPFDWRETRMSHIPVVHEEVHFPKDFSEFLYPSYVGRVNGIELFKASVTVDDYTEDHERIVHFVLLQDHIRLLKNQQQKQAGELPDTMTFTLSASEEIVFPLTAFTRSEDFQVDLSWDPIEIMPNERTNFVFTIRDGATGEPMRNSDYTFVILQAGQELYRSSGQAQVGGYFETYEFAEDQTGPTIIRFENIRGTGQETEFGFVVVPEFEGIVGLMLAAGMAAVIAGRRHWMFRYAADAGAVHAAGRPAVHNT